MSQAITQFQLLAVVLAPILVSALAFVLLFRKLEEALATVRPAPPRTHSDVALFVKTALVVALVAGVVVYMPQDLSPRDLVVRLGFLTPYEDRPLASWQPSPGESGLGRFQWHAFDVDNQTRYPVIECAAYSNAQELQVLLLGGLTESLPGDAIDPVIARDREDRRRGEERLRDRAAHRCVLNPAEELVRLDANRMQHLTSEKAPSLVDLVRARHKSLDHVSFHPVDDVLLARDGTRFYRVNVIVHNKTTTIERRVVSEEQLLKAPRDWYRNFCENKALAVIPCLCPAHLGYVNSGFYFDYPPAYKVGMEPDECDRPWRLWAKARVIRALQGSNGIRSNMIYLEYPTVFPLRVNEKFNMTGVDHAEMTQVEYMDVTQVFDSARGLGLLSVQEPEWITGAAPVLNATLSPLLAVVSFQTLIGSEGLAAQTITGDTNACFNYCLHIDEVILKQAGVDS
jgi:hypothetical protein